MIIREPVIVDCDRHLAAQAAGEDRAKEIQDEAFWQVELLLHALRFRATDLARGWALLTDGSVSRDDVWVRGQIEDPHREIANVLIDEGLTTDHVAALVAEQLSGRFGDEGDAELIDAAKREAVRVAKGLLGLRG
jgi:hypothetical protein